MDFLISLQHTFHGLRAGEPAALLVALLFLSGLAAVYSFLYQLRIRMWPSTRGRLLAADVQRLYDPTPPRSAMTRVEYEYEVQGRRYRGHRYSPWQMRASGTAIALLEKQMQDVREEGKGGIPVYYDPRNPARSFLKRPGIFGLLVTVAYIAAMAALPMVVYG